MACIELGSVLWCKRAVALTGGSSVYCPAQHFQHVYVMTRFMLMHRRWFSYIPPSGCIVLCLAGELMGASRGGLLIPEVHVTREVTKPQLCYDNVCLCVCVLVEVACLWQLPPRFRDKGRAMSLLGFSLYIVYLSGKLRVTLELWHLGFMSIQPVYNVSAGIQPVSLVFGGDII